MAECRWCDSKAWFFKLDRNGLCAECQPEVLATIAEHRDALETPELQPDAGGDWQARLARCDAVRKHLSALLRYEGCEIPSIHPPPSAAMAEVMDERGDIIVEAATGEVADAMANAEAAGSREAGLEIARQALTRVRAFQDDLGEAPPEFGDNNATRLIALAKQVETFIGEPPAAAAPE